MTGPWSGSFAYQNQSLGSGTATATFQQDGQTLSGNLTMYGVGGTDYTVVGVVSGNEIKLEMPSSGYLTVTGNQMTGKINGINVANVTMRKQGATP